MSKITITHEFDTADDTYDIKTVMNAGIYRRVLYALDDSLRNALKHDDKIGENEYVYEYLEGLRQMINEVNFYDDM